MNAERRREAHQLLESFPNRSSALIPILHLVEDEFGHIPQAEVGEVAALMGVTSAYVESVLSFYTLFHRQPTGRYLVQVCRGLSCMLSGSDALAQLLCDELSVERGGTTEDGLFTVEEVECLALCKDAPVLQVNLGYRPRVTPQDLRDFVRHAREEAAGHA
jgi:NADH-quinone oxidoreductase subunit E